MNSKKKLILSGLLTGTIIVVILIIIFSIEKCNSTQGDIIINPENYNQEINASEGQVKILTNEVISLKELQKQLINSNNETMKFLAEELKRTQEMIKKGGSVTVFTSSSDYSGTAEIRYDTIYSKDTVIVSKIYFAADTPWFVGKFAVVDTGIVYQIELRDRYSIIMGKSKEKGIKGFFKPYVPTASIKTQNPYNKIDSSIVYSISGSSTSKFGIGLSIGYGAYISKDVIGHAPYLGVGLNYNLIQFKKRIKK